jgi:hypothetical protein
MSWRFRQSFTLVPGLRLNLSNQGLSPSIGGSPLILNDCTGRSPELRVYLAFDRRK